MGMRASQRSWMAWAASILVPPVGLALLWTRSRIGFGRKLLGSLALVALTIGYVYAFFGLRVELDGSGRWPRFVSLTPEARYAAVEADRARQRQRALAVAPLDLAGRENRAYADRESDRKSVV